MPFFLFTARTAPTIWPVIIPDVASRLRALPVVTLAAPDDAMLRGVIVKLCSPTASSRSMKPW